ncbi:pheophorbide a oxygenase [Ranunculus cassubicifolius]
MAAAAILSAPTFLNKLFNNNNNNNSLQISPAKSFSSTRQIARKIHKFSTSLRVSAPPLTIEEQDDDVSSSKFSWRDHWYPVSLIEDLDPNLATPFELLGREIVLWKDRSTNNWVAFDDKCPHRLAPLSEGRIDEDGNLQCSYHGWSFDGSGSCTRIPQAASEGPEARAVKSPRACATRFPTLVSQGLLFVWPDENGWEKASASKPPIGHLTVISQVTGRRDRAKPLTFKLESSGDWGFSGANDGNPRISSKFVAPCYFINTIEIDTKLPIIGDQKWEIWICSFNVPMSPGKTRSIVCSARNFFQLTMPGPAWWQVVPRWQEHWTSNLVYDGDMIVLQGQEKTFGSSGGDINEQYTKLTFTPTQADRFVLAFRNWLRKHGNSEPQWFSGADKKKPLPSAVLTKRQMLDRFEQHTLKCSSCRGAYSNFQTLKKVLMGATVVFSATVGIPSEVQIRLVLSGLALASAALAYVIHELEKNFVFVDYVHAEIE